MAVNQGFVDARYGRDLFDPRPFETVFHEQFVCGFFDPTNSFVGFGLVVTDGELRLRVWIADRNGMVSDGGRNSGQRGRNDFRLRLSR